MRRKDVAPRLRVAAACFSAALAARKLYFKMYYYMENNMYFW